MKVVKREWFRDARKVELGYRCGRRWRERVGGC